MHRTRTARTCGPRAYNVFSAGSHSTQFNAITTKSNPMTHLSNSGRKTLLNAVGAFAVAAIIAGGAAAAAPPVDESELSALGFKVLVATTTAQSDWVKRLAPGQIRAMQRNGKKFFIFPDAARNQIYIGGPKEYDAYKQAHPDSKLAGQDGAKQASEYRAKQDAVMKKANAHDLSDPYYWVNTATWADLGW